jgi:hypothetical protein
MRKKISIICIVVLSFFLVTCFQKQEPKDIIYIEKLLNKKLHISFLFNKNYGYLPKSDVSQFKNVKIGICTKYYKDKEIDADDWYNSNQMEILYKELLKNKTFSYGFGEGNIITKDGKNYISDYIVLSMFDKEDIQFQRFIIFFYPDRCIIIQMTNNGDFNLYKKELIDHKYVIKNINSEGIYYTWDIDKDVTSRIIGKLRKNESELIKLQNLYNETEIIYKIIK